jgi:hypothetical protein
LAGDAYSICIGNSLKAHEANITTQVAKAAKTLYDRFKYVYDSHIDILKLHTNIRSLIRQKATRAGDGDFFYDGMEDVYDKALIAKAPKGTMIAPNRFVRCR